MKGVRGKKVFICQKAESTKFGVGRKDLKLYGENFKTQV